MIAVAVMKFIIDSKICDLSHVFRKLFLFSQNVEIFNIWDTYLYWTDCSKPQL